MAYEKIRVDILLIVRIFLVNIGKCPLVLYVKPSDKVFWVMYCIFVVVNCLRAVETSSTHTNNLMLDLAMLYAIAWSCFFIPILFFFQLFR